MRRASLDRARHQIVREEAAVTVAAKRRSPAMHAFRDLVEADSLIAYGVDHPDAFRYAAKKFAKTKLVTLFAAGSSQPMISLVAWQSASARCVSVNLSRTDYSAIVEAVGIGSHPPRELATCQLSRCS